MPDAAAPAAKPSTPAIPENFRYSDHPHFAPPRASLPPDHPIHLDTETEGDSEHDVWIFGYGSLLFKVDFECEETKSGWVRGWRRVWWQGSIDHRGTEKYWGRVWVGDRSGRSSKRSRRLNPQSHPRLGTTLLRPPHTPHIHRACVHLLGTRIPTPSGPKTAKRDTRLARFPGKERIRLRLFGHVRT
jgi:hypothetical protein